MIHITALDRLCAIFLAGKIEDHFVNMEDLFRIYKRVPESHILDSEILLLEVFIHTYYIYTTEYMLLTLYITLIILLSRVLILI